MRILVAGALGEVGRSVSKALVREGHVVVPVSSRAPLAGSETLGLIQAGELIRKRQVDLLVVASSQGDHRGIVASGINTCEELAPVVSATGIPSVLLSTLRVLEGYSQPIAEDVTASPNSDYARANAANEALWLRESGSNGVVLRIANYFCIPQAIDSPQTRLLPWSLVTEACDSDAITVKSGPRTSREFVGDEDVARAIEVLARRRPESRICATLPGYVANLGELTSIVEEAFSIEGLPVPISSFGTQDTTPTSVIATWLAANGWTSTLSQAHIVESIRIWLRRYHCDSASPRT